LEPVQFIRDPYVLEFLDLKDYPALRESGVEQAIIDNLQAFLLELGKGFSFVARQKRLRFEDEDFYLDLVFYNYLLRCFVLVDLKAGKLTHQDIGLTARAGRMSRGTGFCCGAICIRCSIAGT
jgi:predicted nuclease of restriction endonuclease-like (RecB) superfamily